MNFPLIFGLLGFLIGVIGAIFLFITSGKMVDEINKQREDSEKLSRIRASRENFFRVSREYRELYPDGPLYAYAIISMVAMAVGIVTGGLGLGKGVP